MRREELKEHFESNAAVANALGIAQSNLAQWVDRGIPILQQIRLEVMTDGGVLADQYELVAKCPEIMAMLKAWGELPKKTKQSWLNEIYDVKRTWERADRAAKRSAEKAGAKTTKTTNTTRATKARKR